MTARIGSARRSVERPEIRLVTVVWGRPYVEAMIRLSWRALLAPGNIPTLAADFDVSYSLHIRATEKVIATSSAQFEALSKYVRMDVHPFGSGGDKDRYTQHWNFWKEAVEQARRDKAIVLLTIPDLIFFDGTLASWGKLIKSGKRAVFSIGTWVSEETFLPEYLSRFPIGDNPFVAISREEGMDLILRHMHPVIAAACRNSGHGLYHFDRMTEMVPGQGLVSRSFSSQPLLFDPNHFKLDRNQAPENRLGDVAMDGISNFSTGSMLHVMEFYHGQPPFEERRIASLVNWAPPNVGMSHAFESQFSYRYMRKGIDRDAGAWDRADAALDDTRRGVLAIHSASQVWRHAKNAGCNHASNAIALAIWRHSLHRSAGVEKDFTVFLPTDEAFRDDARELLERALRDESGELLTSMILDHIVPRRLYLRPGDELVLGDGEVQSLSKRSIRVRREGNGSCPRVVGRQRRIGFGAVYCIDQLLSLKEKRPK